MQNWPRLYYSCCWVFLENLFLNGFFSIGSPGGSPSRQGVSETEFMERIRERMAQEVGGYVSRWNTCVSYIFALEVLFRNLVLYVLTQLIEVLYSVRICTAFTSETFQWGERGLHVFVWFQFSVFCFVIQNYIDVNYWQKMSIRLAKILWERRS